jgi:hypothetical protein
MHIGAHVDNNRPVCGISSGRRCLDPQKEGRLPLTELVAAQKSVHLAGMYRAAFFGIICGDTWRTSEHKLMSSK